jgi:hypothetical protein
MMSYRPAVDKNQTNHLRVARLAIAAVAMGALPLIKPPPRSTPIGIAVAPPR